ncbi:MAG: pantetheine-phosphate adenylyltransferase [Sphingomonadales bacterium]|nr:pantetheine-phosphate adenylyltransferase [Sphingomonadales bacterium]
MSKLVGLYPGTFDPLTYGHLDIVRRGMKMVDKLIIGVATNPSKAPMFTLEERVAVVEREVAAMSKVSNCEIEVRAFDKLLMHFAMEVGAGVIIRGLRAVSDFEYEFQMAGMNAAINPDVETVFLMADAKLQSIASKLVKEIAIYGGDISSFTPSTVVKEIQGKVSALEVKGKK